MTSPLDKKEPRKKKTREPKKDQNRMYPDGEHDVSQDVTHESPCRVVVIISRY